MAGEGTAGACREEREGTGEGQSGVQRGIWWALGSSGSTGRGMNGSPCSGGIPEHRHSHCSWGHLWHLLWPQAVPMLPQQSSCLVRPGSGLLPHYREEYGQGHWAPSPHRTSLLRLFSSLFIPQTPSFEPSL